jgi:predicted nucleotidyltransferase
VLSQPPNLATLLFVEASTVPPGVIERIIEVLAPEEVWLFGSRARNTHGPESDWDLMAILPDTAPDRDLDLAAVWGQLRELRRMRVEVIPMRRRDFEASKSTLGELAEAVAREGHIVYGR